MTWSERNNPTCHSCEYPDVYKRSLCEKCYTETFAVSRIREILPIQLTLPFIWSRRIDVFNGREY